MKIRTSGSESRALTNQREETRVGPCQRGEKSFSPPGNQRDQVALNRVRERYKLLDVLQDITGYDRIKACRRRRISADQPVRLRGGDGKAYFAGVQTCGSIWACPVCAAKIRARRVQEVGVSIRLHREAGGWVETQVLTFPHGKRDALGKMLDAQSLALKRAFGGEQWKKDQARYGIVGRIAFTEGTIGPNGWHPHTHLVHFYDREPTDEERVDLQRRIYTRFAAAMVRQGYRRPQEQHCKIQPIRSDGDLSHYLAAMEMLRLDMKSAVDEDGVLRRTPFQILRDFAITGDVEDLDLWREWEQATHGRQAVRWSKGLKGRFGIGRKTDEEIAAEQAGGEDIWAFVESEWKTVTATRGGRAGVRHAAATGGAPAVAEYVADLMGYATVAVEEASGEPVDGRSTGGPVPPRFEDVRPSWPILEAVEGLPPASSARGRGRGVGRGRDEPVLISGSRASGARTPVCSPAPC